MEDRKTGCTCENPGFCNRHQIVKTPHYFNLCKNHQGYYNSWEACRGPSQRFIDCNKMETGEVIAQAVSDAPVEVQKTVIYDPPPPLVQAPGVLTKAGNFMGAMVDHAKNRFKMTEPELKAERLKICEGCPLLIKERSMCGACGCNVNAKASLESSKCPKGYW